MFGGPLCLPKEPEPRPRRCYKDADINMVSSEGMFAHRAREPNTDYDIRMLHYKQREREMRAQRDLTAGNIDDDKITMNNNFQNRIERRLVQSQIKERFQEKLQEHYNDLERRRELLRQLLAKEEEEHIRDTISFAQKADDTKLEDMKVKSEMLRRINEAERQEIVRRKRLQQYAMRSQDLRPYLSQKNKEECRIAQLQQIRENEARREADRELDKMWNDLTVRRDQAMLERETQEALELYRKQKENKLILEKQMEGKRKLEEERRKVELENRIELENLQKQVQMEEVEDLKKQRIKREQDAQALKDQMQSVRELDETRKQQAYALEQAFKTLSDLEYAKELKKIESMSQQRRQEVEMYKQHLVELREERKREEQQLEALLVEYQKGVLEKDLEKQCKVKNAKLQLEKDVMAERAKQIEIKKERAMQELEYQKDQNAMLAQVIEINKKLETEMARHAKQEAKEYRDDLRKQIEYNQLLRLQEREELERKLKQGLEEEQFFRDEVNRLLTSLTTLHQHPFRVVLERFDCHCNSTEDETKC